MALVVLLITKMTIIFVMIMVSLHYKEFFIKVSGESCMECFIAD